MFEGWLQLLHNITLRHATLFNSLQIFRRLMSIP